MQEGGSMSNLARVGIIFGMGFAFQYGHFEFLLGAVLIAIMMVLVDIREKIV
jgi:hypothetical protein